MVDLVTFSSSVKAVSHLIGEHPQGRDILFVHINLRPKFHYFNVRVTASQIINVFAQLFYGGREFYCNDNQTPDKYQLMPVGLNQFHM